MPVFSPGKFNLSLNPLLLQDGDLIRCVNVTHDQFSSFKKRAGYATYLGTPDNDEVTTLFHFRRDSGTQFWNYRMSGGTLYYSQQGTGAWTNCGNGTFPGGGTIGHTYWENTLTVGNGIDATRHSTDGTSFTNTSAAPIAGGFVEYQNRTYAIGTASDMFYSTTGTPSDWTTDSSSIHIPGGGRLNAIMKTADRIVTSKNTGLMHRYDGYNLFDLTTTLGPRSAASIGRIEDFAFYGNGMGYFGFGGNKPEIVSNPIEKQIYNDTGKGIPGTSFDTNAGVVHRYEYIASMGTAVTDDLTDEQIVNPLAVYDYQADEWFNWSFGNRPTAFLSYKDETGNDQMIFGDSGGQCYTFGGLSTSDNGATIPVVMEGILHMGTLREKKWDYIRFLFNPGMMGQVQVAMTNSFTKGTKNWITLGPAKDGVVEYKFPSGSRSTFLNWKITEASRQHRLHWFAGEYEAEITQLA